MLLLAEEFLHLSKVKTEFIEQLRNRTFTAILVISIAYIFALVIFVVMLIALQSSYCFFAMVIPLLVYLWLITYGGIKHVNNHYRFKQTSQGILLYKKRRENYTTYT